MEAAIGLEDPEVKITLIQTLRQHPRRGLSLLELLVVLTVVGLFAAIIIPAVLALRESNRRLTCRSKLVTLGQAIAAHESTFANYPSALKRQPVHAVRTGFHIAGHVYLLPFLDQSSVFATIRFNLPGGENLHWDDHFTTPYRNEIPKLARIDAFICPSEFERSENYPGNNYRLNTGSHPSSTHSRLNPNGGLGAFAHLENFRPSDFRDGLGSTIAMSERNIGTGQVQSFDPRRDYWFSGVSSLIRTPTSDTLIPICQAGSLSAPSEAIYPFTGAFWFFSHPENSTYNHANTPNSPNADCSVGINTHSAMLGDPGIMTARSMHKSGVNVVFMDGHAAFISDTIDLNVWRALSTRSGGEQLGSYE